MNTPDRTFESLKQEAERGREAAKQRMASISNGISAEVSKTKGKIHDTLDWRAQARNHPMAIGAAAIVAGYVAARLIKGRRSRQGTPESQRPDSGGQGTMNFGPAPSEPSSHYRPAEAPARAKLFNAVTHSSLVGNLGKTLVNEVEKVGRDLVIPAIIGLVTSRVNTFLDSHKKEETLQSGPNSQTNYMR